MRFFLFFLFFFVIKKHLCNLDIHNSFAFSILTEQKTKQEKTAKSQIFARKKSFVPHSGFSELRTSLKVWDCLPLFPVCAPCFLSQSDLCACSSGDALLCYLATVSTATKLLHVSPPPRLHNKSLVFLCCFVSTSLSLAMRRVCSLVVLHQCHRHPSVSHAGKPNALGLIVRLQ